MLSRLEDTGAAESGTFVIRRWATAAFALALLVIAGCEFDPSGTGNGPPPQLGCGLDLTSGQFYTDLEPGMDVNGEPVWGGILTPGDPMMDEPFWIGWTVHYFGHQGDPTELSGPFNTRVEIVTAADYDAPGPDTALWSIDLTSDPVKKGDFRTDGVLIESGLPAGEYIVKIILDTEGDVFECFDLVTALNNFVEYPLTVLAEPIDDVVNPGGGGGQGGVGPREQLQASQPDDDDDDEGGAGSRQVSGLAT